MLVSTLLRRLIPSLPSLNRIRRGLLRCEAGLDMGTAKFPVFSGFGSLSLLFRHALIAMFASIDTSTPQKKGVEPFISDRQTIILTRIKQLSDQKNFPVRSDFSAIQVDATNPISAPNTAADTLRRSGCALISECPSGITEIAADQLRYHPSFLSGQKPLTAYVKVACRKRTATKPNESSFRSPMLSVMKKGVEC